MDNSQNIKVLVRLLRYNMKDGLQQKLVKKRKSNNI